MLLYHPIPPILLCVLSKNRSQWSSPSGFTSSSKGHRWFTAGGGGASGRGEAQEGKVLLVFLWCMTVGKLDSRRSHLGRRRCRLRKLVVTDLPSGKLGAGAYYLLPVVWKWIGVALRTVTSSYNMAPLANQQKESCFIYLPRHSRGSTTLWASAIDEVQERL